MSKVDYFELTEEDIVSIWRTRDIKEYISKLEDAKKDLIEYQDKFNLLVDILYEAYLECLELKVKEIGDYLRGHNIPANWIIYDLLRYSEIPKDIKSEISRKLKEWSLSRLVKLFKEYKLDLEIK